MSTPLQAHLDDLLMPRYKVPFQFHDGGRAKAGYMGNTGDCGVRAVAIAAEMDYVEVYKMVITYSKRERITKKKRRVSHPRTGIWAPTYWKILADLGFQWTPTMGIGTGCQVHVKPDELPGGRLVLALSRHYTAFIDGVLHDTYNCAREGTRCVYGYWEIIE